MTYTFCGVASVTKTKRYRQIEIVQARTLIENSVSFRLRLVRLV